MRILQVSNRVPWPLNEGGTLGIYNYTRSFSRLGHDVTLYCLDGLKHNTPINEAKAELSKYAKLYIHPINTDLVAQEAFRSMLRNESYNVSRFYNAIFEEELVTLLKSEKFDVIQLEGTYVGPYLDTIKKHFHGLIALRMHNVEYEIWERLSSNEKFPPKKVYLKILAKQLRSYEEQLLSKVDVVIPVTENDAEKFKKIRPDLNVYVSPAGINLEEWQFKPSSSFTQWYHIGSMEWHANKEAAEWFITEIHPRIASSYPSYTFHLAGKGIDKFDFSGIAQLKATPYVSNAISFVTPLDVCVVPLKSGSGIRVKILEAMAAGKLVISTTVGAQGIPYTDGEHLLIAESADEFYSCFKKLVNNEIDGSRIIENARRLIEQSYSTDAITQKLVDFYSSALGA